MAITMKSLPKALPCPTCADPIDLSAAILCQCLSTSLSAVCPSCRACFCKMRLFPRRAEWIQALRDIVQHQAAQKSGRPAAAPSAGRLEPLTILIVDDDE